MESVQDCRSQSVSSSWSSSLSLSASPWCHLKRRWWRCLGWTYSTVCCTQGCCAPVEISWWILGGANHHHHHRHHHRHHHHHRHVVLSSHFLGGHRFIKPFLTHVLFASGLFPFVWGFLISICNSRQIWPYFQFTSVTSVILSLGKLCFIILLIDRAAQHFA